MSDCQSCKEDRSKKNLPAMTTVRLPAGITDTRNFRKPGIPTWVCPHCDGETLIASALRHFHARQD